MVSIKVRKLNERAELPQYMTEGAAGCDVMACLESAVTIKPLERAAVSTGLAFEIPAGFEVQVRPRSGLAIKQGLTVVNAPGTIDSDYRGEVKILLVNLGDAPVQIDPGQRIAQLVVQRVERADWSAVDALTDSARDTGGFGSTGK